MALHPLTLFPHVGKFLCLPFLIATTACLAWPINGIASISLEMAYIGDAGNPADQNYGGYGAFGSVAYDFMIGKYEVTNTQYASFLNAVAATDTYLLYPATNKFPFARGIIQTGSAGAYSYSIAENMADKPANYINWFSAVRFTNWLANGQPTGLQGLTTTENGAYALNGTTTAGFDIVRNTINPNTSAAPSFWLPSESEWYKAAYYDPTYTNPETGTHYWLYAPRSNALPTPATATATGDIANPGENVANFNKSAIWNGDPSVVIEGNVTTVGSAGDLSDSYYGTYDQDGNVWEWSEGIVKDGTARGLRQGSANDPGLDGSPLYLAASFGNNGRPPNEYYWNAGFRVAASIPEPSTALLGLLACGIWWLWKSLPHKGVARRRASAVLEP
jgi:formylglycine-generating enzyme required for sulfatase activity